MTIDTPEEMFERELEKLYHAELEILELHSELAEVSTSDDVRTLFESHDADTNAQIHRIEAIFEVLEKEPRERGSALMEGVLAEKDESISEVSDDTLRELDAIALGMINERIEITLLDRLLFLADELDLPREVSENLDQNRSEAAEALRRLESFAERTRFD